MDGTQSGDNNNLYSSLNRDSNNDAAAEEQFEDNDSEGSVFTSFMKQPAGEKAGLLGGLRSSSAQPSLGGLHAASTSSTSSEPGHRLFSSYVNPEEEEQIDQVSERTILPEEQQITQQEADVPEITPEEKPSVPDESITFETPANEQEASSTQASEASTNIDASDDELSEQSFPLFLSFKANDNITSVSNALREKAMKTSSTTSTDASEHVDLPSTSPSAPVIEEVALDSEPILDELDDFDIDQDLLNRPIFKPVLSPSDDSSSNTESSVPNDRVSPSENSDTSASVPLSAIPVSAGISPSTVDELPVASATPVESAIASFEIPDVFSQASSTSQKNERIEDVAAQMPSSAVLSEEPVSTQSVVAPSESVSTSPTPLFFTDDDKPVFKPFSSQRSMAESSGSQDKPSAKPVDESPALDIPSMKRPAPIPSANPFASETPPVFVPVFQPTKNTERPGTKDKRDNANSKDKPNERPGAKERFAERQATLDSKMERPGGHDHKDQRAQVVKPTPNKASQAVRATVEVVAEAEAVQANERSISNRYTAAQQMGKIAPLPSRDIKASRKKGSHLPILFAFLSIAIIVSIFALWTILDMGSVLFGRSTSPTTAEPIVTATTLSTADQTSSVSAVATTETSQEVTTATTTTKETTTATTTKETTVATTTKETTAATTKETTAATTKETTAATTKETTAATTKATTTKSGGSTTSAMIPSAFATSITDGKSSADTASFTINFKNTGATDVSLLDGVENITVTFVTNGAIIESVTSDDFIFTPKEGKTNVFIGVPVSTDIIAKKESKAVSISAVSEDGVAIGKYSVKYYVLCYS